MITKRQYVEYLISTVANYTGTHLAEHLDDVSHDTITDYLRSERLTARSLWELVQGLIVDSPEAFLIVDDSVQDKRYSRFIELVKRQYSGAEHGLVRGIGIVNLVFQIVPDRFRRAFAKAHCAPLVTFAVPHFDLVLAEIQIVDDQVAQFLCAKAGIEEHHDDHTIVCRRVASA